MARTLGSSIPVAGDAGAPPSPVGGPRQMAGLGWRETALFAVLVVAVAGARAVATGGPQLQNDSYQYLSVADNVRRQGTASTSLVHFDAERAHGVVPAPATTFPPGYPAVVAALSGSGVQLELAAVLVSLAAAVLVIPFLGVASRALALGPGATRAVMFGWAFSAQAAESATSVLTESLFTALAVAAVAALLVARRQPRADGWIALAGLLSGLAYHVRYAGLFFAAALHLWSAVEVVRGRSRRAWIAAVVLCDALIALGVARNVALTGTWRGGNTKEVARPLAGMVERLAFSWGDLLLGNAGWLRAPIARPATLLAIATVAGLAGVGVVVVWTHLTRRGRSPAAARGWPLVAVWAAVYCAAMSYAGLTTVISLGVRMFVPVLPLALLLLGATLAAWVARATRRAAALGTALLMATGTSYAGVNLATALRAGPGAPHDAVTRALDLPTADGEPLSAWIARTIPAHAVVLSVAGEPTGYVIGRRTVSAVSETYSDVTWTEDATRAVMSRFGATWLVVYPEALAGERARPDAGPTLVPALRAPFLAALAEGRCPPWLTLSARNGRTLVFERRP